MSDGCPTCRTFAAENEALHREIAGLNAEVLGQVRSKQALKAQQTRQRNEDALNEHVTEILELWLELCVVPKGRKRTNVALNCDRADDVRKALRDKTKGSQEQRRDTCMDAVRGLALRPYESFGQRYAAPGPKRVRKCDIIHALGTDVRIEDNAAYWRWVQERPAEWRLAAWEAATQVEAHFRSVYFDAVLLPEKSADRDALVEPGLSVLPGTFVELPQPERAVERPRLFVVPNPDVEAA